MFNTKISRRNFLKATGLAAVAASLPLSLTACGGKGFKIAVPNDTTNEARALLLLQNNGILTLADGVDITATKKDISDNPYNVTIDEVEAAQIPNVLKDEDYAVINSNYAIAAGIDPMTAALAMEDSSSKYVNILVCKEGNENTDKIKAIAAALKSQAVADFITSNYAGAVVSTVDAPIADGLDTSVDYAGLKGQTISCACSPAPHAEILAVASDILTGQGVTLDIQEYDDYIVPNNVVEDGTVDCNYFQHQPYLDDFNAQNGTHLVSVAGIHVEPMGIYGGKQTSLDALKA
jgi:D-methionine transport system substrate-binding protein